MLPVRIQNPSSLPVTLAEAKKYLIADDFEDDDAIITGYLSSATAKIERELDLALVTQTWRQFFCRFDSSMILSIRPAASIESVWYFDRSGTKIVLPSDRYSLFRVPGGSAVVPAQGERWPDTADRADAVTIDYIAGNEINDVPADLKLAVILDTASLYANREGAAKTGTDVTDAYLSCLMPYRLTRV